MPLKLIEKDAQRMHEHTPDQPVAQMPQIACPDLANADATDELREDGLDAVANACQDRAVEQASQWR